MQRIIVIVLSLILSGRAMTLAYIHRAGGSNPTDPPAAWLMPLIGDATIGLSALFIVYLLLRHQGLWVWTCVIVWNALAIWDALSAWIINMSNPWPDFFMLKALGPAMFFGAIAMHLIIIVLVSQPRLRKQLLGLQVSPD